MAFALPTVVPKSRTVNLGAGGTFQRQTFGLDLVTQSRADLRAILIGTAVEETRNQERLGNPPQLVEVDNRTNKPLTDATSKVVVLFGTQLAAAAMRIIETTLRQAIVASTYPRTGTLANVGASWQWRFVRKGGAVSVVTSGSPPKVLARGDRLVLVPVRVPYATAVNRAVARSGSLNRMNMGKGKRPPKASQNLGFLATATRAVRRRSEFRQFAVLVEFTKAHAIPGEVYSHGTGVITLRPRFKQVRV